MIKNLLLFLTLSSFVICCKNNIKAIKSSTNENKKVVKKQITGVNDTIPFLKEHTTKVDDYQKHYFENLTIFHTYNNESEKDELFIKHNKVEYKYSIPFSIEIEFAAYAYKHKKDYILILADEDFYGCNYNIMYFNNNNLFSLGSFFVDESNRESIENYKPTYFKNFKIGDYVIIKTYKNSTLLHAKVFQIENEVERL